MSKCHCPKCGCELPVVALPSVHVFAADLLARRALDFLAEAVPILVHEWGSFDRRERLEPLIKLLMNAIDDYGEIRIGCVTRVDIDAQRMTVADCHSMQRIKS
jgi:hypothetical protein